MAILFYSRTDALDFSVLRGAWQASLTAEEADRLASLRFERDQRDYLAAHALLRIALRDARGTDLTGPPSADRAGWSLTHTDGLVACGVSHDATASIGVDAEFVAAVQRLEGIADMFLGAGETSLLPADAEARSMRMVEIWTAKEAVLKALGQGFSGEEGFGVLPMLETGPYGTIDDWTNISVRDTRSGAAYSVWERWVDGYALAVGAPEGTEGIPRLMGVNLR